MFEKLSADVRKSLDAIVRLYEPQKPLVDYVTALIPQHFPALLPNIQSCATDWSQEQVEAAAVKNLLVTSDLMPRGYAQRILYDSVEDLARSTSLEVRCQFWQGTRDANDEFLYHAIARLKVLGVGDIFAMQRFVETVPPRVTKGNQPWRFTHGGMAAVIRRSDELLATAIADFETWAKPLGYVRAIYESFRGLLAKDSQQVVSGLEQLLKASKQIKQMCPLYKVISLELHGMYELCRYYDRRLVADFDTERDLPWDRGLHAWVRQHEGQMPFYDVSSLSPVPQRWLTELPFRDDRKHHWSMEE